VQSSLRNVTQCQKEAAVRTVVTSAVRARTRSDIFNIIITMPGLGSWEFLFFVETRLYYYVLRPDFITMY
jgi:hypothetical protein